MIRTAAGTEGTILQLPDQPNRTQYDYFVTTKTLRHTPTTNITVNLTPKNRLQGSYYWQYFSDGPDTLNSAEPTFPTLPAFGLQTSYRTTASITLRSTLSTAMVNEARGGWAWSPVGFFTNTTPAMFDNQFGYNIGLASGLNSTSSPEFFGITNAASGNANTPEERNTPNYTASDSFNWLKGSHAMNFGGDYTHLVGWLTDSTHVPSLNLGFETNNDPANAMFTTANFPGATDAQINGARALYRC